MQCCIYLLHGNVVAHNASCRSQPGSAHDYSVPGRRSRKRMVTSSWQRGRSFQRKLCAALEHPSSTSIPAMRRTRLRVGTATRWCPLDRFFSRATVDDGSNACARTGSRRPVNHFDRAFASPRRERDLIGEFEHPDAGKVRLPGNRIKMSGVEHTVSDPARSSRAFAKTCGGSFVAHAEAIERFRSRRIK